MALESADQKLVSRELAKRRAFIFLFIPLIALLSFFITQEADEVAHALDDYVIIAFNRIPPYNRLDVEKTVASTIEKTAQPDTHHDDSCPSIPTVCVRSRVQRPGRLRKRSSFSARVDPCLHQRVRVETGSFNLLSSLFPEPWFCRLAPPRFLAYSRGLRLSVFRSTVGR